MKWIRVGAATLNQTPLDWENNRANIVTAIRLARGEGVSVLCLPELCITGYGCEDEFFSPGVGTTALEILKDILPQTKGLLVALGLPLFHESAVFNVSCLVGFGKIFGFVAKRFLAKDGVHYEPRWFRPWPARRQSEIELWGDRYPLGDLLFDCGGVRIGFEICEDAWSPQRPGAQFVGRGIDLILNPSASHFAFGKHEVRKRFVLEGSRAFGVGYVYSNLVGNESGRLIYDGGAMVAAQGHLVAVGPRFSFQKVGLTTAPIDLDALRGQRSRAVQSTSDDEEETFPLVRVPHGLKETAADLTVPSLDGWEKSAALKEEEFCRAVSLGLFDYLRKSRSKSFIVSLSGGADSSAATCLIGLMVHFGVQQLGERSFAETLGVHPPETEKQGASLVKRLLTCVYQATENSSHRTRESARAVALAVGAEFIELEIQPLVDDYMHLIEKALGLKLSWKTHDLALQNVQARVRAPGVWLIANLRDALLLTTCNRSEAAVGYATMDGDTAGGLSPLGGIDKAFLRRWLRWMESIGPAGAYAIPSLALVNSQEPTAELRPQSEHQTDESDLMPYEILDFIERLAIRDKRMPQEVLDLLRSEFPKESDSNRKNWVTKFFRLWSKHQWKRERYAPSFHLDDESLDPKTWCRFPILSGGFERELGQLK